MALYGGYWDQYPETCNYSRGIGSPATIRGATRAAKVALCLVRRANRDGHVMRSFEIPATGTCMVVEETDEHRAIFGSEGEAVRYFNSVDGLKVELRDLLTDEQERERLARAARKRITQDKHTYRDRLITMLHHPL